MKLTYNYDRKDIFGLYHFTSDETSYASEKDIDVVFKLFKKDPMSTIHIQPKGEETWIFTWEHYDDCENGVVTMIYSEKWNIREPGKQMTLAKAKKLAKSFLQREED